VRILFLGDTHGETMWVLHAIAVAKRQGIRIIVQAGDFGFWEPYPDGVRFLDRVSQELDRAGIMLVWVDGNHENHEYLRANYHQSENGMVPIRKRIVHAPRGSRWEWDRCKFLALGGAFSIDKKWRTPGKDWWPEELITTAEAQRAIEDGYADIMVTHDCPGPGEITPWDPNGEPDRKKDNWPESVGNRRMLDAVFREVRPKLLVHGHYHNTYRASLGTSIIQGLGRDGDPSSLWTLDTDDLLAGRPI
jgi:predicted phosphodiesterase